MSEVNDVTIVRNAIQTPDGTILHSKFQHDCQEYQDANGEVYMVDGGNAYFRGSINVERAKILHVTSEDDFSVIRQHLTWWTYGKNGDQPLTQIALCDMEVGHIQAILHDSYYLRPERKAWMEKELELRT